jgi:hypothetical protein
VRSRGSGPARASPGGPVFENPGPRRIGGGRHAAPQVAVRSLLGRALQGFGWSLAGCSNTVRVGGGHGRAVERHGRQTGQCRRRRIVELEASRRWPPPRPGRGSGARHGVSPRGEPRQGRASDDAAKRSPSRQSVSPLGAAGGRRSRPPAARANVFPREHLESPIVYNDNFIFGGNAPLDSRRQGPPPGRRAGPG